MSGTRRSGATVPSVTAIRAPPAGGRSSHGADGAAVVVDGDRPELQGPVRHRVGRVAKGGRARGQEAVPVPRLQRGLRREPQLLADAGRRIGAQPAHGPAPGRGLEGDVRDAEPFSPDPGSLLAVLVDDDVRPPVRGEVHERVGERPGDHLGEPPRPDADGESRTRQAPGIDLRRRPSRDPAGRHQRGGCRAR